MDWYLKQSINIKIEFKDSFEMFGGKGLTFEGLGKIGFSIKERINLGVNKLRQIGFDI